MFYIARCKCGAIRAAINDDIATRKEVAHSTGDWIKRGYSIEQLDQFHFDDCTCNNVIKAKEPVADKNQISIFSPPEPVIHNGITTESENRVVSKEKI